jgi:hypothetical protein
MKKITAPSISILLLLLSFSLMSFHPKNNFRIEKRHYRKGFYVDFWFHPKTYSQTTSAPDVAVQSGSEKVETPAPTTDTPAPTGKTEATPIINAPDQQINVPSTGNDKGGRTQQINIDYTPNNNANNNNPPPSAAPQSVPQRSQNANGGRSIPTTSIPGKRAIPNRNIKPPVPNY